MMEHVQIHSNLEDEKMERFMYRAQTIKYSKAGIRAAIVLCDDKVKKLIEAGILMTVSLFQFKNQLFLYYECIEEEIKPQRFLEPFDDLLESWPGMNDARKWILMPNIFHFDRPVSPEQWKRRLHVDKRVGRIAQIKQGMLSSYIFHHYQLQEEKRETGNKYCVIGLNESLIFHYEEFPSDVCAPSFAGSLTTSNTPADWRKLMDPHFIQQKNADGDKVNFIVMEPLISY
jgi:hypothetical protein